MSRLTDAMAGPVAVYVRPVTAEGVVISKPKVQHPLSTTQVEELFADYPPIHLEDLTPGHNPWLD